MALKIDRDVPMPRKRQYEGSISGEVPWESLKIGDSVLVPRSITMRYANPGGTLTGTARQHGISIKIRTERDGIRIWRKA